ncbi:hypothetical protein PIB30_102388, partial [Stylosanthes scabra]|nr:hypothetical protein [Stylosanthes scabra]
GGAGAHGRGGEWGLGLGDRWEGREVTFKANVTRGCECMESMSRHAMMWVGLWGLGWSRKAWGVG